jgi:hypothetical protein
VTDIENYKGWEQRLSKEQLVLFLMATYGDGEPTDNAADFYSWICAEGEAVEGGEKEPYMQVRMRDAGAPLRKRGGVFLARPHGRQEAPGSVPACIWPRLVLRAAQTPTPKNLCLTCIALASLLLFVMRALRACRTACLAWATSNTSTSTQSASAWRG